MPELRRLISLENFHDRMKIRQAFFDPLPVPLDDRVGAGGTTVNLAPYQHRVKLSGAKFIYAA